MKPTPLESISPIHRTQRQPARPRSRASIVRGLRRALPALSEKYKIKSFGIFGSYARGEQKVTSDLDVLVECDESLSMSQMCAMEEELSWLLRTKVDLHETRNLKPYVGKNILRETIWLQKDNVLTDIVPPHRIKRNRITEPKREYLDYFEEMVDEAEHAQEFIAGISCEELQSNQLTSDAIMWNLGALSRAAKRVPPHVRRRYPNVPWKMLVPIERKMQGKRMRPKYPIVWQILTELLPQNTSSIVAMLKAEKKRRGLDDAEKTEPAD